MAPDALDNISEQDQARVSHIFQGVPHKISAEQGVLDSMVTYTIWKRDMPDNEELAAMTDENISNALHIAWGAIASRFRAEQCESTGYVFATEWRNAARAKPNPSLYVAAIAAYPDGGSVTATTKCRLFTGELEEVKVKRSPREV